MSQEFWRWSATQLTDALRTEAVSSQDVVQSHLDRIEAVNTHVNAITVVLAEDALNAAKAADAVPAEQRAARPLHGLPITVKENIDVAGSATTSGIVSRKDLMPETDAPVIAHLKAAGAIVIGRTNMPDFGLRWHTDNTLRGATVNPWAPNRTPGGSSGGEAAALATGMSPLGIGNDMGGSTRQPAINCGVAGLRPSTGLVSSVISSIFDYAPTFYEQVAAVNGPMARSIADLRLALSVMSQPDPLDPLWTGGTAPPPDISREHHVGLIRDPSGMGVDPGVAAALDSAVQALTAAGNTVEEIDPDFLTPSEQLIDDFYSVEAVGFEEMFEVMSPDAVAVAKSAIKPSEPDALVYRDAIAERHRLGVACSQILARYPLLLGPVSTLEPFEVGYDLGGEDVMRRLIQSFRLTECVNLLGLPAIALPACLSGGIPQGVQIIGRRFDEARLFNAAEAIEVQTDLTTPIDPVIADTSEIAHQGG